MIPSVLLNRRSLPGARARSYTAGMSSPSHDRAPHRLADERIDYTAASLEEESLAAIGALADPLPLFGAWIEEAFARRESHGDISDPSALVLSTVDASAPQPRPRSRTVLLKDWDARGFVVYTNKDSAKGEELRSDPFAAMLLPWFPLQRQVRIEGRIEDAEDAAADAYWASRPRASQLGGWASDQSRPVRDRAAMEARYAEVEQRFAEGEPIPRPPHWGGYRLVPERIEFWQGRAGRFHDRLEYARSADGTWQVRRLQP